MGPGRDVTKAHLLQAKLLRCGRWRKELGNDLQQAGERTTDICLLHTQALQVAGAHVSSCRRPTSQLC